MERDFNFRSAVSVEAWNNLGDEGQAALASRAAKRGAYIARCYGAQLDADEIWGDTWKGIAERLNSEYLSRHSGLTLEAVAFRAARAAAERLRYDWSRHSADTVPLEDRSAADNCDTERSAAIRAALENCLATQDERSGAILRLIAMGYTERQIGKVIGISGPAVHKRIVRIRQELQAALG